MPRADTRARGDVLRRVDEELPTRFFFSSAMRVACPIAKRLLELFIPSFLRDSSPLCVAKIRDF
jgi:hypothetical protein